MKEDELRNLWSDSGVKTGSYIEAPKYDGPVATVDTFGSGVGYYSVSLNTPTLACAAYGDVKTPCKVAIGAMPQLAAVTATVKREGEKVQR